MDVEYESCKEEQVVDPHCQGDQAGILVIHLVKEEKGDKEVVEVGKQARSQLVWWLLNLRAVGILEGAFITDPDGWFPR